MINSRHCQATPIFKRMLGSWKVLRPVLDYQWCCFNSRTCIICKSFSFLFYSFPSVYEPRHDKTNKISVRPAKTQISLGIRPVWSESSLCAQWIAKDTSFLHADSEDSGQTGRMPRLIWVFAGCTVTLLVLSCRGLYFYCVIYRMWW